MSAPQWTPNYQITPAVAQALMKIEAAKAVVDLTPLPPAVEARLRERARLRSTHFSTYIEGNRLTLAETREAVAGHGVTFHGREQESTINGRPHQSPPCVGGIWSACETDAISGWTECHS